MGYETFCLREFGDGVSGKNPGLSWANCHVPFYVKF